MRFITPVLSVVGALGGFWAAHWLQGRDSSQLATDSKVKPIAQSVPLAPAPILILQQTGSEAVVEIFSVLERASVPQIQQLAVAMLNDPKRRRDLGLWGPMLARWSALDGAGMMQFVQKKLALVDRSWLEGKAWYAWGTVAPVAAIEAGRKLPTALVKDLINGLAQTDAVRAAEFALTMPDAQFNIRSVVDHLAQAAPDMIPSLIHRAVYDGMRMPLQAAQAKALVEKDPAAALALAQRSGKIGVDPVPDIMRRITEQSPAQALTAWGQMPSNRSRALCALELAKTWANTDAPAATAWARQNLSGPVQQGALLEIANASGGADPLAALMLVSEAGWTQEANFHRIAFGENLISSEVRNRPTPTRVAGALLRQLGGIDPAAAQSFLQTQVPVDLRPTVAKRAGLTLTAP